jgi:LAO/AO transport system kinase
VAKLISLVEAGGSDAEQAVALLYPHTGGAYTVGITGSPGAGKSTLTDKLVGRIRRDGTTVGVLAIDPSSPFTGGAILGDRVRMQDHATDPEVFIRSMATRGHLGGLALATPQAVRVLDAAGKAWILVETVGVGQVEVEIAGAADTTAVIVNPRWGDAVQANKAGLLEIADIFVVNKADRDGTNDTVRDLEAMLTLTGGKGPDEWRPPVVTTVATTGEGVDELWDCIAAHRAHQEHSGDVLRHRRARLRAEIEAIAVERLRVQVDVRGNDRFEQLVDQAAARELDPYAAAAELLNANSC